MSRRRRPAEEQEAPSAPRGPFRAGVVAIVGRPNVGKSTLLNQFLRQKLAIVTPRPQTTRHRILGVLTGEDYQVAFLDTPGMLQKPRDPLDQRLIGRALEAIEDSDLAVLLVEPAPPGEIERRLIQHLRERERPALLAINKVDTVRKETILPVMEEYSRLYPFRELVPISALKAEGTDLLLSLLVRHLPEGEPLYGPEEVTDRPERFFVAELVREQVFLRYREEVPYQVAVEVEEFREAEGPGRKDYIRVVLYVDHESQKAILIGKGGEALKKVATEARREIEAFLGRPIYLEVWVKVHPRWRKDTAFLKRIGY